ncbi:DNA topoisomerase III [Gammaproteobacteria bacterium]
MTRLYLCEKPSQARDIARVLGALRKGDGCLMGEAEGRQVVVTWCYGHLLEMMPPDGYDPAFKRWSLDILPIVPTQWRLVAKSSGAAQLKAIQTLLKSAIEVIIATDADREGELIAREVLTLSRWRGPVRRLWLSALDDVSIRKALATLLPGAKTEPLWQAGLGRARADWLVGMNLTRAYTVTGRRAGYDGVLSVGRVQTPTLKLIVDRDRTIASFVSVAYFDVAALFTLVGDSAYCGGRVSPSGKDAIEKGKGTARTGQAGAKKEGTGARGQVIGGGNELQERRFRARWVPPEQVADAEGRCIKREAAEKVVIRVVGRVGSITKAETKRVKEPPPLPFDLSTLQQIASRRLTMGAQQVLDTAQALYETHKAITYPRTDCPYLPESQHREAPGVLAAVAASDSGLVALVRGADATLRSRAWDESKITAHHAIIPTAAKVDVGRMNATETQLYDLIRRRYLAQFYPAYEYDHTEVEVEVEVEQEIFRTTGRVMRIPGWRTVLGKELPAEGGEDEVPPLPAMTIGESSEVLEAALEDKQTRPPPHYTEGTLIAAMKNVGRSVADPKLKKVLKETSGIGTEATRASIIEILIKRNFLVREGKRYLHSTPTGQALVDALPEAVKDPATTALWEQGLDEIARGEATLEPFLERQARWVGEMVALVKTGQMPVGLASLAKRVAVSAPVTTTRNSAKPTRKWSRGTGGKSKKAEKLGIANTSSNEEPGMSYPRKTQSPRATTRPTVGPIAVVAEPPPLVTATVSSREEPSSWGDAPPWEVVPPWEVCGGEAPPPWEEDPAWEMDVPPPSDEVPLPRVRDTVARSNPPLVTQPSAPPTGTQNIVPTAGDPCPSCNQGRLIQRTARRGSNAGGTFLGCSKFPHCRYTVAG